MAQADQVCQDGRDYLRWLRSCIGHELIPLTYSTAVVRDSAGRVLLHRRSDFNVWGLPGGVLEPGESPAGCACRETEEETGLQVEPTRLIAVLSGTKHTVEYPNGDRAQQISPYFECTVAGGELRSEDPETLGLGFFDPAKLPPTLPWYAQVIRIAAENRPDAYFDPPGSASKVKTEQPIWKHLRSCTGPDPLVLPGATALIRDESGGILFIRRADTGAWSLPGGLLELGENLADTVIREVAEETGLRVTPRRLLGILGGHEVRFPGGDRLFPIGTWFECEVRGGRLRPDGEEADRVEFFPPDDLPAMPVHLARRLERILSAGLQPVFN